MASAAFGCVGEALAQSPQALINQLNDYRYYTVRRHNDIQGVEQVFDDYRKNWLRRQNSGVLVGEDSRDARADTPICGDGDFAASGPDRAKLCGSGNVARASTTALYATDTASGAKIQERASLSYFGYERLLSRDMFIGAGVSGLASKVDNKAGAGVRDDVSEFAGHLLGGYRLNNDNMLVWNLTAVRSSNDTWRPGDITGHSDTNSLFATGAWYRNVQLSRTAYVSLGLDYTLQLTRTGELTESDGSVYGSRLPAHRWWQGDFTGSALFVQTFDRSELFARVGLTAVPIDVPRRPVDMTLDVGGTLRLSDKFALTGSVGTGYLFSDYVEYRGNLRLIGRF